MHPRPRRCSSLEYCPIFSVVAPCGSGRLVSLGARRDFHHGPLAGQRSATWATLVAYAGPPPSPRAAPRTACLPRPDGGDPRQRRRPRCRRASCAPRTRANSAPTRWPFFPRGLKDQNPRVRAQAARTMGRFESPALIGQIIPLLVGCRCRRAAGCRRRRRQRRPGVSRGSPSTRCSRRSARRRRADWAVLAASLGRIGLPVPGRRRARGAGAGVRTAPVTSSAQVVRPARWRGPPTP